ncbi:MAG: 4Fe-4S binding protein [Bacillota bacterium]
MLVRDDLCTGCGLCEPYCPVGAIAIEDVAVIDQDRCVECAICYRSGVCPLDALELPALTWPRLVRALFSDPLLAHPGTGVLGRGTEEMKTNDVTGRFQPGQVGVGIELGRPGMGTSFRDVEVMATRLAALGIGFEPENPVTQLMVDGTGRLRPDVLDERALSAIIEFTIPQDRLLPVLAAVREAGALIETVFSLDVIVPDPGQRAEEVPRLCREAGFATRPNGKTNVGLGHGRAGPAGGAGGGAAGGAGAGEGVPR